MDGLKVAKGLAIRQQSFDRSEPHPPTAQNYPFTSVLSRLRNIAWLDFRRNLTLVAEC